MKELSLNILDIAHNSVKAKASEIIISVEESLKRNIVAIDIKDNGCGMDKDFLSAVTDPFVTTRTTRKVGLGIPLLRQQALDTDGHFDISSQPGRGTEVYADFKLSHLDRPPVGDIASTVVSLISANPSIRYVYTHLTDFGSFTLDTDEVKEQLGDIPLNEPEILIWLTEYINENLQSIEGGKI
ncbi:MAG: ATP-binding protein [Clostridia bacterium]|nr:ATP-binding protein [Clostridia bacterium]